MAVAVQQMLLRYADTSPEASHWKAVAALPDKGRHSCKEDVQCT